MIRLENPPTGKASIIFENMEEQKEYLGKLYGSIDDETFVRPEDGYPLSYHEAVLSGR